MPSEGVQKAAEGMPFARRKLLSLSCSRHCSVLTVVSTAAAAAVGNVGAVAEDKTRGKSASSAMWREGRSIELGLLLPPLFAEKTTAMTPMTGWRYSPLHG